VNVTSTGGSGTITSWRVSSLMPRFDYNPSTLAAQGLLIEESRTNSIRNNTMVGAVAGTPGTFPTNWVTIGGGLGTLTQQIVGTGTSNGITYIDVKISGTTSTTSFGIQFESFTQIAALSGQTWTGSFWVSRVAGSNTNLTRIDIRVHERDAGGASLAATGVDLLPSLSTTLTRNTVTRTMASASTAFVTSDVLFVFNSGAAIDITLRIGLPQLEQGAFATSVIPTTTTALTRSADVASVNTLSPWYNASAGTLFAEYNIPFALTSGANSRLATLLGAGGAAVDELPLFIAQASGRAASANAFTGGVNAGRIDALVSFTANTSNKAAYAYASNDRSVTTSGSSPTISTAAYTIPTVTTLRLGQDGGGTNNINGYLRRITYYPRRLSNADLQTITT
jgi:hypothetical protein